MNLRIEMNKEIKDYLSSIDNLGEDIEIEGKQYRLVEPISQAGYKSVLWKGVDNAGIEVAIKLATHDDYIERSYIDELQRASKLYRYEQFAKYFGAEPKKFDGDKIKVIAFAEEWVEGVNLSDLKNVTPSFILSYVSQLTEVLNILKENDLRHDDLHLNNVMIVEPQKGSFSSELKIKVIDMGSLKTYRDPLKESKKGFNDLKRFCEHLVILSNRLLFEDNRRKILNTEEVLIRLEIKKLLDLILEEDQSRALSDPKTIKETFESAYFRSTTPQSNEGINLNDPFDYISAEHIGNDKLLNNLFAESCPWLEEVTSHVPILLTGPRGCGKSMIFRWLSLKSVILRKKENIIDAQIAGFYVSCSAELRNRFNLFQADVQTAQAKNEIIHYFNLLLCNEVIYTFLQISKREDRKEIFGIDDFIERKIYNYLIEALNIEERRLFMQGVQPFEHIYEIISREMRYCYQIMLRRDKISSYTTLTFLADFTRFLKSNVEYFKNRSITFLLDDYSTHKISESVQKILNPILWDRQHSHIFKVSSEKLGMINIMDSVTESSIATSDLSREYTEVDVGLKYINHSDKNDIKELIHFSSELLNHRLNLAGYMGDAETLIGKSQYPEGSLAKALRNRDYKKNDIYHGLDTISKICSGDISALLEIYKKIFKDANVTKSTVNPIPKHIQNNAIVSVSRSFLELIKTYQPYGHEMYNLVVHFGNLCSKILTEGKMQGRDNPNDTTRIEVEILERQDVWANDQDQFLLELIRRSVFISLTPGRGRHTGGSTLRLQLRRIYCPHLKTGLTKNTAIKLNDAEFKLLLISPEQMCDLEFKRRWKPGANSNSSTLF